MSALRVAVAFKAARGPLGSPPIVRRPHRDGMVPDREDRRRLDAPERLVARKIKRRNGLTKQTTPKAA